MKKSDEFIKLVKNLKFEDAVSYTVHSRVFEILGYISLIQREDLPEEIRVYLKNIEKLNKNLIKEIHLILDDHIKKQNKLDAGS